jgi:inhibitor of KinA sporulation pathway (predicted exonuclease)
MNLLNDNIVMVLDTEYDTNPKRLLSLAYIIYDKDSKTKKVLYVKHDPNVFKVNEYGESFKYHKLTNQYLYDNGKSLEEVITEFNNDLDGINIVVGQNIMTADIHMIRKEAIGLNLWFNKIREKLLNVSIFDTMKAFKNIHNDKSASLDNIYKFLTGKEMKDHHKALDDCKNTFKCYKIMLLNEKYSFACQKLNFSEDLFDKLSAIKKQCFLCKNKILLDDNGYILKTIDYSNKNNKYTILNANYLEIDQEICKKCLNNLELVIFNDKDILVDLVKLKVYEEYIKKYFEVTGIIHNKVYLNSSYKDKNEIKKIGGRWDGIKKSWYCTVSEGDKTTLQKFKKWIPENSIDI